ncbi:Vitamin B12 import ATP-binding protein BtuD [subsurface metagenome]
MENRESMPCVELRNLVKRFPGVTAVDHVSLKVEKGKVFSLLGPSGCGKTTALRIIAGLETMDEGDVLIDGKVINDVPAHKRDCSIVFQTLALFPHMTVEANVSYGLEQRKVPKDEIRKRVGEIVDLMGLGGMEKRRPSQLSGGQQQRVALARSLTLNPKILLLDEPLASLDRKLRKEMQVELKRIQREVGITFLYVTHDQKEALSLSDTIAVMDKGKLEQVGTPEEIYETPRTKRVADFIGAGNIFPGKVIASGDGKVQLETEDGLRVIALEDKDIRSEEVTGISVHPELVEVLPEGTGLEGDNRFRGKIVEMIYQGDFIETKISLGQTGEKITVHLSSRLNQKTQFSSGEGVLVHWSPESSNILLG